MIRLRLPANLLQVYELAKLRVDKDVMAPARPPQLEPERLHEPLHVREGHVRDVAAGEPREEPLWIHGATLPTSADEILSGANLDAVPFAGRVPVAPVQELPGNGRFVVSLARSTQQIEPTWQVDWQVIRRR